MSKILFLPFSLLSLIGARVAHAYEAVRTVLPPKIQDLTPKRLAEKPVDRKKRESRVTMASKVRDNSPGEEDAASGG